MSSHSSDDGLGKEEEKDGGSNSNEQDKGNVVEPDTKRILGFSIQSKTSSSSERREQDVSTEMKDEVFQFKGFHEMLAESVGLQIPEYKMDHPNRGLAVIFNHEFFDPIVRMNRRVGTEKDVINLRNYLGRLGFRVRVFQDLTVMEIKQTLCKVSQDDHTNSDCFLCTFLSHGDDGVIYGRDGTTDIQELFDFFRGEYCPSLVGKPKIFLVQACRGEQHEIGVLEADSLDQTDSRGSITTVSEGLPPTIPAGADFLLSYSVTQGYYSHRDTAFGSWYIQALSKVLELHGTTMEFTQILTLVNQLVAQRAVERCLDSRMIGKKQIPCFVSMLTKRLIFRPKVR